MRTIQLLIAAGLLLTFLTCDRSNPVSGPQKPENQFRVALPKTAQQSSRALFDSLRLSIATANGDTQRHAAAILPDSNFVLFDIDIPQGQTTFLVELTSNSGAVLYSGSQQENINQNNFDLSLPLENVSALLALSPDTLVITNTDTVTLHIRNSGVEQLFWQIDAFTSISGRCSGDCFQLSNDGGIIGPGQSRAVSIVADQASYDEHFQLRVNSNVGFIDFPVYRDLYRRADLAISSVEVTDSVQIVGPPDYVAALEIPVRIAITNTGDYKADLFRVAAFYINDQLPFRASFATAQQPKNTIPFTTEIIPVGGTYEILGSIITGTLPVSERKFDILAEADACVAENDTVSEPFCRIDELNEDNNIDSIAVPIPLPDLIVSKLARGDTSYYDQNNREHVVAFQATIKNIGNRPATGLRLATTYSSNNYTGRIELTPGKIEFYPFLNETIAAQDSLMISGNLRMRNSGLLYALHSIYLEVDSGNGLEIVPFYIYVWELDESNNISAPISHAFGNLISF